MRKLLVVPLALVLSACEGGSIGVDFPRFTSGVPTAEEQVTRAQFCRFAREAIGMPVLLNSGLRSEAYAALGNVKAASLFRPVARANNSFRYLCGTPEEREVAKC